MSIFHSISISFFIAICFHSCAYSQPSLPADSESFKKYNYLNSQQNAIQFFSPQAINSFYRAWQKTEQQRLTIVLLGDSHLQTGHYPEQLSRRLQKMHGAAGFGLFFPNTAVQTYAPIGYSCSHKGKWQAQRSIGLKRNLPLGLRGMTCRTEEVGATLDFEFKSDLPDNYTTLKIYCRHSTNSLDLLVKINDITIKVPIDEFRPEQGYISIEIPPLRLGKISVQTTRNNPQENHFELYGFSLETAENTGVLLHNAGVGAAQYNSILYQSLFSEQLATTAPQLVVIDFGTNDYLYDDKIKPELRGEIINVIKTVKNSCPDATILLTSVQDLYWKGKNCIAATEFADMIYNIAREYDCAYYDWFRVSGGLTALGEWRADDLAQKDMVHLTPAGYRLKADLMYEAILNTINFIDNNPNKTELSLKNAKSQPISNRNTRTQKEPEPEKNTTNYLDERKKEIKTNSPDKNTQTGYYIVQAGDSAGKIASKYKITVPNLCKWNDIKDPNKLKVGQKLRIIAPQ